MIFKEQDIHNIVETGIIASINALWLNEWINVGVASASLVYLGYKTYLLHKNDKKENL